MLIVTTESVPGYRILEVLGEVFGVTARTHNPYNEGVRSLTGGVQPQQIVRALSHWREEAIAEMARAARQRGANAVIGMRFDNREISSSWAEICAYGTAVRLEAAPVVPGTDVAVPQSRPPAPAARPAPAAG
jgi:uncharacterized protein YbjQ (UPF0145 family)